MNSPQAPRRIQEHLSVQLAGTETLLYDERRHKAFCLNRSSSVLWRLCDGRRTIAQIAAVAGPELSALLSEEFVLFAVQELRADGLIEPCSTVQPQTVSRRGILRSLGAGGTLLLPGVAAIFTPTAAQAYSGCFDCSEVSRAATAQRPRAAALVQSSPLAPIPGSSSPSASPYGIIGPSVTTGSPLGPAANPPWQGKH